MSRKIQIKFSEFLKENSSHSLPIGTKVKKTMGIRKKGEVIPKFPWRQSTDGTYSEPSEDYVAIKWDDGSKGYSAISYLDVLGEDGEYTPQGTLTKDEDYDTTSDDFTITLDSDQGSGKVEFSDGIEVDYFTIYDDGKIAFDRWYPQDKYKTLVDAIESEKMKL